ncbi:MAG: multiheme c-type cytochrome [Thermodesulfovibrionales bacterium]|jgi:cytochrome c553|nr:multiheme c-type cytochrome [Thermodesulfovibrionales bacterium]
MKHLRIVLAFVFVLSMSSLSFAAAPKSVCIDCHKKVTPGVVKQHLEGKMSKKGVDCSSCHGSDHKKMDDAKLAKMPTPETCAGCHQKQVDQFKSGKHHLGWIASSAMPMWSHQPKAVVGEGYKGCSSCHKIGVKSDAEKAMYRYGNAQCDSCHTRHSFKKSEAQDPRACQTCHMGFDHPQWEMWSTSKHGTIWQIEGAKSKRAPTCQTCHMQEGNHGVMTAWGFLALRLPEDDKDWLNDRVTILQALGVLDEKGNPTARLDVVKAGKVARLTKEDFQKERDKMINVCSKCHGASYAKKQLEAGDMVIKDVDKVFATAIRVVQGLYKDGVLQKPADWTFAPDLLQFYEAKSSIEQDLYLMFLEYRMRTFQGAFHMNPDYMHWYGWAPMKETLQKIKDEAAKLRAEKASARH